MLRAAMLRAALVLAAIGLVGAFAGVALAQEAPQSLAGKWQAEPMTVRWVIGSWGDACGPRPSGGGDNGGIVTIEERGSELVIAGDGSSFSTEQCWQMGPGLERQSHSANPGVWKTTCRSPSNDPRQELLQTSLTLAGGVLSLQESGQYQFSVRGQTCAASSGRWRTYRRLPAAPPPAPQPVRPCATPGAPARIEVRPSRKLMRAGESFHFRASVYDEQGCSVGGAVQWALAPEGAGRIDAGRLTLPANAPDGQLQVTAAVAGQSVRALVDVVTEDRYAALLATGRFDADGSSAEVVTSGSVGTGAPSDNDGRSDRKWTFVGLVSGIALLFALIGAWLLGRAHRAARAARARRKPAGSGTVVYPGDDVVAAPRRRPLEATRLEQPREPAPAGKPATVCPVCGTMYETRSARNCPKDGALLLPINA
jgi:hypothetical protein